MRSPFKAGLLISLGVLAAMTAVAAWWLGSLVCDPLSDEELRGFNVPIEQRTDEAKPGVKVFQRRNGQWHQCKTRLSRALFM